MIFKSAFWGGQRLWDVDRFTFAHWAKKSLTLSGRSLKTISMFLTEKSFSKISLNSMTTTSF